MSRFMMGVSPLVRLQGDMTRLWDSMLGEVPELRPYSRAFPALNIWEEGDAAFVEAELPGVRMEDLEVLVTGSDVTINGERKIEEPKEATFHRRERSEGRFSRSLTLPWEVDADKVEAHLTDGVLTLKLPKCESCKPRKVKVVGA